MGILESLAIIFLILFLVGLIISVTLWLMWLFLILAVIIFAVKIARRFIKKIHFNQKK